MTAATLPGGASDRPKSSPGLVLFLLMMSYALSFMDRTIFSVLQEPIKRELLLSDTQVGLLGGLAFGILYSLCSLPIGRLAERADRSRIISWSLALWSLMTTLSGAATSFWTMALCRAGVGLGEAGGVAPAHSLIADVTPPKRRGTAIAIYSLGLPIGALMGSILGGWVGQHYGWRAAFLAFGIPGLFIAVLIRKAVRDPREFAPAQDAAAADIPSFWSVCREFLSSPVLRNLMIGTAMLAFVGYSINGFLGNFFLRKYQVSLSEVGLILGLITGVAAAIGTMGGGIIVDRLSRSDIRWYCWLPSLAMLMAAPIYAVGLSRPTVGLAVAVLFFAPVFQYLYMGPVYALVQNLVSSRMRASSTAIMFMAGNLVGLGLGPPAIGFISDLVATDRFQQGAYANTSYAAMCPGGVPADPADLALAERCLSASGAGVQLALMAALVVMLLAGFHYYLASRGLRASMLNSDGPDAEALPVDEPLPARA